MKIAFQMDSMVSLNFKTDTTWQLMIEASKVAEVYHFTPDNLFWKNGLVYANLQKVEIKEQNYFLEEFKIMNLAKMDIIFIRQDPPYDIAYLTTTYLLEKISKQVLILNNPRAIRDFPEKISVLDFVEFIPPTLITYSIDEAESFVKNFGKAILKPLYNYGGNDVFCISEKENMHDYINLLKAKYKAPFIVQKFLENVKEGDKRIILVQGEPIGCFIKKPPAGSIKANLACGGTAHKSNLTDIEKEICNKIKPMLQENNLFLAGIDVIDSYLIEINITSPTGIVALKNLENRNISKNILDNALKLLNTI